MSIHYMSVNKWEIWYWCFTTMQMINMIIIIINMINILITLPVCFGMDQYVLHTNILAGIMPRSKQLYQGWMCWFQSERGDYQVLSIKLSIETLEEGKTSKWVYTKETIILALFRILYSAQYYIYARFPCRGLQTLLRRCGALSCYSQAMEPKLVSKIHLQLIEICSEVLYVQPTK